jgi:broad specificity phosphatase PhoE
VDRTIFIMRHGETEFNTQGRYQGQLDSPLTEHGMDQVRQMARLLRILGYDFNKVETDSRLSEVSVGSWSGLTLKEIEQGWSNSLTGTTMYD